jgi:glycosyltransferase involved in cell wall biosynthesis
MTADANEQRQGRRLLLCTYGFPPAMGPRGLRLLQLTRALLKHGWQIDVLTARLSPRHLRYDAAFSLASMPPGIRVFRTFPGPLYGRVQARLQRRSAVTHIGSARRSHISSQLDAVLRAIAVPDIMVEWLPFALQQGHSLFRETSYDLLLSAGLPFTAHLLGYLLKRLHKLPWVAEYGDPWAFNPISRLPRWRHSLDTHLEARLLRHADGIVVTTEPTRAAYLQHYHFLCPNNVWVVASGYGAEEYATVTPATSKRFRLVYTGVFYPDIRSPRSFLEALKQLHDLDMEVVMAGPADGQLRDIIERSGLNQVQLLGDVPNTHAIALQKGCSLLFLMGNATPFQLPLKTFEYIGAGRPILCIRNNDNDLAANLVASLRRGIVVEDKPDCIASAIREAYDLWKCGLLNEQFNLGDLNEFTWSNAGAKLHDILSAGA